MKIRNNIIDTQERGLTFLNFSIATYFTGIYIINKYCVDYVIIGVFRELLTIPFLIAQLFFVFLGLIFFLKKETKNLLFISSLCLLIANQIYILLTFF